MSRFSFKAYTVLMAMTALPVIACCQPTLVPYRAGKLWGLSDLQGKLVVQPAYDKIEALDGRHWYITERKGKVGTLYQGRIVIKPVGNNLRLQDGRFIIDYYYAGELPNLGNTRAFVYNLQGKKLLQSPVMELNSAGYELVKNEPIYITWAPDNKSQVFVYDDAKQKIKQLILDNQPGMLSYSYSAEKKEVYIYRSYKGTDSRVVIRFNNKTGKYTSAVSREPHDMPEETRESGDGMDDLLGYQVKNNYVIRSVEFIRHEGAVKRVTMYQRYKDRHFTIDTAILPLPYDSIFIKPYVQGNGTALYQHSTEPNNATDLEQIDTLYTYRNYILFRENGKTGLVPDAYVFDAQFDSVSYFQPHSEFKPYFMVTKTGEDGKRRKGVVRSDGKVIMPLEYDSIIYNKDGGYAVIFILVRDRRYGIALHDGTIVREPRYDLVTPNKLYYSVNIHQDGRYGYYDINGKFCEPLLPLKASWVTRFNDTELLKLTDAEGNLIGYANFNGTVYFRD